MSLNNYYWRKNQQIVVTLNALLINSAVEQFFKIKGCAVSFHLYNAHLASGQPLKQLH